MKVGILAVQGDYEAHGKVFARLGVEHTYVTTPAHFNGLDALVLPGGESTTQLKFLTEEGLEKAIRELAARGGAFFGTCAGAILLAREVRNPHQASLGLTDLVVLRNAYGRQVASDVRVEPSKLGESPLEMVFIRAPIIEQVGPGVEVLAESEGHPVLVREGRVLTATFHPELTEDTRVHEFFLKLAAGPIPIEPRGPEKGSSETSSGPAEPTTKQKKKFRVLFVCIGNSCRSQMAEALARHKFSDVIEPSSGGVAALGEIASGTCEVLAERGVSCDGQFSKQVHVEDCRAADLVVNMAGVPWLTRVQFDAAQVEDWDVPDPYGSSLELHRQTCDEIERRLDALAARLRQRQEQGSA